MKDAYIADTATGSIVPFTTLSFHSILPYRYICERHGEIGRSDGMSWVRQPFHMTPISYDAYAPGEMRCQKCYWENVIVPNCGLVTKEEIK